MFGTAYKNRTEHAWSDAEWPIFARVFLLTFGCGLLVLYLFILLVDPFGTGRFPALPITGIVDEDPRTANIYRGRDQRFDSAIFGNSTGQLLSPARLAQTNGSRYVQLTIPGSGPREQLTVWRWFVEHHDRVKSIVLVADASWCTDNPALPILHPFPFWLYSDRWLEYASNIFSMRSLDRSFRRLKLPLGLQRSSDPTGYSDYELGRTPSFSPEVWNVAAPGESATQEVNANLSFPAINSLNRAIAALPSTVAIIIITPPVFFTMLPKADTQEAARATACQRRLAEIVSGRRHSGFIDMFRDLSLAHDPANFMDASHYRAPVAKLMEARIAAISADEQYSDNPSLP